jgi:hypothetical protein
MRSVELDACRFGFAAMGLRIASASFLHAAALFFRFIGT